MPDRRIAFEGAENFRDLGGYESHYGGTTRWRAVYRAAALDRLTPGDLAQFEQLGIRTVYDLRGDAERQAAPDPMPSTHVRVQISNDRMRAKPPLDFDEGERFLGEVYRGLLIHAAPSLGWLVRQLARPDLVPAVFHCTAGKDRTGVAAAVVLEALGVQREVVLDDFELTAKYARRDVDSAAFRRVVDLGVGPAAAAGMLGVSRWMMADALSMLDDEHGGVDGYLTGPAGLDGATIDGLRANLLV